MTSLRVIPAVVATVLVLAGCGIPADGKPRHVAPPPGPYGALSSNRPSTAESGVYEEVLYFTKDGALVRVTRRVRTEPTPSDAVKALMAGPTAEERARGIGSSLSGIEIVPDVSVVNGLATVDLTAQPEGAGRTDVILAYAQVVCTLDARPNVTGVRFTLHDQPIDVPRGSGALPEGGPLTAADYSELIAPS